MARLVKSEGEGIWVAKKIILIKRKAKTPITKKSIPLLKLDKNLMRKSLLCSRLARQEPNAIYKDYTRFNVQGEGFEPS